MQNPYPDKKDNQWLDWAIELQFIAQAGLTYSKDVFDLERFERIRAISAEIMSLKSGWTFDKVNEVFCNETGFQTPKLDTRAVIIQNQKILLVKEKNGTWSLPGGWVDVNESVKSNTIKEVKEESGYTAIPLKILAVQDRKKHNKPEYAYGVCKIFVLCDIVDGDFTPNSETLERRFFALNELPLLATEKNTKDQIELCFKAYNSTQWETTFD
ncbi:NUDIX hydrolase N-terminal domain-containing protein [Aestuariibaculum sediminum]|uniref:NUDIX hydrolase n=1 Tax=Aestuariibaculum sediminum TaxID=2770637 RepID=A0A8J6QBV6_9FLAO|nr:NUDIX hydrolase [Aestuariibaculum sediminum]MBD0833196.1 NUDIX hydrolase [Aestuariibaculum sediminum]